MIPGDNMEIIYTQIGAMADTTISTMNQLSDTIQRVYKEGVNAPRNSEEYALFHSLEQYLRTLTNQSRGVAQPNAALPNVLSNLIQEAVKGNKTAISDLVRAISDLQSKLYQKDNNEEAMERLADSMGITLNDLMNSTEHHIAEMNRINTQRERYQAEQTGSFIAKAIFQNQNTAERKRDFKAEVAELIRTNPKFQGTIGRSLAEARVAERWTAQGRLSSDLVGPDGGAGGPIGGQAAQRAQQAKFIQGLVTALVNSPLGQKVQTVASDLITMGMLSLANKAPAWVQKGLLLAIAMGLPQTLTQVLTQMMLTTQGRQMLGQGMGKIAGAFSSAQASTAGMTGAQLARGAGALTASELGVGAIAVGVGAMIGNGIMSIWDKGVDKVMGKKNNNGNIAKAIGGILLAVIMGALIAFGTVTGIVPVCLAIGAAIAGIWHALTSLWKWWKGREEAKDGEEVEKRHWWDDMFGGGGGGGGGTPNNNVANVGPGANYAKGKHIKGLYGDDGQFYNFIDTHQYEKSKLEEILAKNKAYENISGGGIGWTVHHKSFENDVEYMPVGTSAILNALNTQGFVNPGDLIVTSALGSASSPHKYYTKDGKVAQNSHYVRGGKLDFSLAGKTKAEGEALKAKLLSSGFFDFVDVEEEGGLHIDAKIKESLLEAMNKGEKIPTKPKIEPKEPQEKEDQKKVISDAIGDALSKNKGLLTAMSISNPLGAVGVATLAAGSALFFKKTVSNSSDPKVKKGL